MSLTAFPVGYHTLNADVAMNYQLNRFWNWAGEARMLDELKQYGPTLTNYDDWIRQLLALGEKAFAEGRALPGAYFLRAGEFFMSIDDPRRAGARQKFLETVLTEFGVTPDQHHEVAYADTTLSAYRFTPDSPRSVVVVCGGFDSYIEEWIPFMVALRDSGLDVIAFDGPGQGAAFEAGMPMTADWHKPVGAVLDHFGVDDVTLMGFSLGGCLVMRAAAYEQRVTRVIAHDVLTDFTACLTRPLSAPIREVVENAGRLPAKAVDYALDLAEHRSLLVDWEMANAARVFGVTTPAEVLDHVRTMRTDDISHLVTQDVLLMAGASDHYVPLDQIGAQIQTLTNARSISARIFTAAESAQNHCQIGNLGLAFQVITGWITEQTHSAL